MNWASVYNKRNSYYKKADFVMFIQIPGWNKGKNEV